MKYIEDKIDYYNMRFLYHFKLNNTLRFFDLEKLDNNMRIELDNIISNNYEYMLTESFINYLTNSCSYFLEDLSKIYDKDRNKINEIVGYYFDDILRSLTRKKERNEELPDFTKLLEGNIKEAVIKARESTDIIFANYEYNEEEIYIIRGTIISLLTDCFINNDINSFNTLCDIVLDDPTLILDDIRLNGLDIEDEELTNSRLVSIVKNQNNKRR